MFSLPPERVGEIKDSELHAFFLLAVVAVGNVFSIAWLFTSHKENMKKTLNTVTGEQYGEVSGRGRCKHKWFEDCEPGICY